MFAELLSFHCCSAFFSHPKTHPSSSAKGKRLVQLHRRATSRFKLSSERDAPHENAVLRIWLLYSLVLLKYGSSAMSAENNGGSNDAKQTLKHVQRLYFRGSGREFYGALASDGTMDDDDGGKGADGAVSSLRRSLDRGASIVELVRGRVSQLEKTGLLEGGVDGSSVEASSFAAKSTATAHAAAAPVRLISLLSLASKGSSRGGETKGPTSEEKSTSSSGMSSKIHGTRQLTSNLVGTKKDVEDVDNSASKRVSLQQRTDKRPLQASNGEESSLKLNQFSNSGGAGSVKPSLRETLEARKRLKITSDRNKPRPYRGRKPNRETKGGLRAILSQTMDEGDDSDGSDDDCGYVTAKRSADSCIATKRGAGAGSGSYITAKRSADSYLTAKRSANPCASTASSLKGASPNKIDGGDIFKDISPIDNEATTSVKDMDLEYLLSWDPTKRDVASTKKQVTCAKDKEEIEAKKKKTASAAVPKITQNDLGYMMNWDPLAKFEKKKEEENPNSSCNNRGGDVVVQRSTAQGNQGNNMSTIDEATEERR